MRSVLAAILVGLLGQATLSAEERPNFLWIVFEDIGPDIGPYGDRYASTPHLDRFAAEGVVFERAFSNGGACAPARSTLITGMYPPAIGTHHMRSRGVPPSYVRGFTEFLRKAGYYTSNHSKTDYNWEPPATTWDAISPDWSVEGWRRRAGKPFFTVINITDTHSSQIYHPWSGWPQRYESLPESQRHSPDRATVPPYYPQSGEVRSAYARYADNISYADRSLAEVLAQLEEDGLADSTIVFFFSDHGAGMPRSKSFLFESSLHVPLIVRFPEAFSKWAPGSPGSRTAQMVSFVDFAPTILSLAGLEAPEHLHGSAFLGVHAGEPRKFVFGYRDRMDERYEFIRSVRGDRFKYIRNYFPHLPWFHEQTRLYPSTHPVAIALHRGAAGGLLRSPADTYMARRKPREQLFDAKNDPHEIKDLAADSAFRSELEALRTVHRAWVIEHTDLGFLPESEMWLSYAGAAADAFRKDPTLYPIERILETADWVGQGRGRSPEQVARLSDPVATVRFWATVGLLASDSGGTAKGSLSRALNDSSPAVAAIAAQALCATGDCDRPLQVLTSQLQHEDPRVSLRAANAIHQLGERAAPVRNRLLAYHRQVEQLDGRDFFRTAEYPHWVLRALLHPRD